MWGRRVSERTTFVAYLPQKLHACSPTALPGRPFGSCFLLGDRRREAHAQTTYLYGVGGRVVRRQGISFVAIVFELSKKAVAPDFLSYSEFICLFDRVVSPDALWQ